MVSIKNFLYKCVIILFLFCGNSYSQYKIFTGIISNGNESQSNSVYTISGTVGETGVAKSSNADYQTQPGFWNYYSRFIYPATLALNADYTFGDVTKTSNYQIIGIPGADNLSIADFMKGQEGKTGDWRAFIDTGAGDYKEYDSSDKFRFRPGNAFWLISKNPINITKTVGSVPLSADRSFAIPLHNGWNLISDPFNEKIDWNNVKSVNKINQPLNYYLSGSYISNSDIFEPYKGYYFYNSTGLDSLKVPYIPVTSVPAPKRNILSSNEIELFLESGSVSKSGIKIGFSDKANSRLDRLDLFSPPSNFCDINISLFNKDLETNYKYLQTEYRQNIGEGQEYNVMVKNTSGHSVNLEQIGAENFTNYEVFLLDRNSMKFYNLKTSDNIEINSSSSEKDYGLFVGTEAYMLGKEKTFLPSNYELFQNYPNPFNPATRIKFALPVSSKVSLKIYNILGQLVAVLINNRDYDEGYHEVEFIATSLSSGVYFYRITADSYTSTKKMLIIK